MNIGIIIHSRPAYAMDWNGLISKHDIDTKLILITNYESLKQLSDLDRKSFIEIVETTEFKFDELSIIFQAIGNSIFQQGDKVRVSTVAEYDMIVTAQLRDVFRESLSIEGPGIETILNFRDKIRMKNILGQKGIRIPKFEHFNKCVFTKDQSNYISMLESKLMFPMFVKPIDGAASIETDLLLNKDQLIEWGNNHIHTNQQYEIDEYIDGDLFHCDSIIENGEIKFTFVSRYLHPNADARLGLPLATMTMSKDDQDYIRLKEFAESALLSFPSIPDGCTHLEVFISHKNSELIFLEVAARPPGSKAPEMYRIRTGGIDIRSVHTKLNLGLPVKNEIEYLLNDTNWGPYASMWDMVSPSYEGIINELHSPVFSSNYILNWNFKKHDIISPRIYNGNIIGSVIFWNEDYSQLVNDFNSLDNQKLLDITITSHCEIMNKIQSTTPDTQCHKPSHQLSTIENEICLQETIQSDQHQIYDSSTALIATTDINQSPFDFGEWASQIKRDAMTGEPIFIYHVYKNNQEVGSAEFYGQPILCLSPDKQQHNIIKLNGVLTQFHITDNMPIDEICRVLPPSMFDRILFSASKGALHGALRGSTNIFGVMLQSANIISRETAYYISKMTYYSSLFTMKFIAYLYQNQEKDLNDSCDAIYHAAINAAIDTGNIFIATRAFDLLSMLINHAGELLKNNNWHYTGSGLKKMSTIIPFGIFAYRDALNNDVRETSAALIAGMTTEILTEKAGKYMIGKFKK